MSRISNIAEGWKNYLSGRTTDQERARARICKECPAAVLGTYEKVLPDFQLEEVQGLKCSECGCPLVTKIRSTNSKCDLDKWPETPTN